MKTKIAVISVLLVLVALFVFGCWKSPIVLPPKPVSLPPKLIERTGQDLSSSQDLPLTKASLTADDLAAAILTPGTSTLLTAASMSGVEAQFEVYTASLQGFPTDGSSYALMSNGWASGIAGVATDFYSYATGGPTSPPLSHRDNPSYDIATLSLTLSVPAGATTLSFDWKFGTEESPTYIGSFVDWASAIVTTSDGSTNILLLPDGKPVDVDNAIPFSNAVTGSSNSPGSPYPSPNDTIYNAVTGMYTSTFNVASFVGETIRIDFQVGDENDQVLDSALFIDNLNIEISNDKPYIYYIEPDSGAPGIDASIIGRNFKAYFPMVEFVDFGGENISAESWSDKEIKVKVPYGKGVVDVKVVSNFQESNPVKFTYNEPFIDVDGITPSCGLPGEEVTISGKDFGYKGFFGPSFYVNFGCSNKITKSWTDTKLVVNAPLDCGTGKIEETVLKYLIKIAAYEVGVDIPGPILDKISDLLLKCDLKVEPSGGKIEVPVRVHTPAGTSNAEVFTYQVSTIIEAILFSPGELRVYDSLGRVTGLVNGEVKEEIPYSLCDDSSIVIVSPFDSYRYEVVGTDEGTYRLVVNFVENAETTSFSSTDIPVITGAIHQYTIDWETLSQGGEGVNVQIDLDGDGTFDITIPTNSTFTFVPTTINIKPDTLNLNSNIKWVTAYIELPEGYDVTNIDVSTVNLWYEGNNVPAEWGDIQDGTLMVKFDGEDVQDLFPGPVDAATVAVTGELQDGTPFVGNDAIRVIEKP